GTCLAAAPPPIHWVPPTAGAPSTVVANDETMKFWFSAQSYEALADSPFAASPAHSPISPSRPSRCSAFDGGRATASRTLCKYHAPSFFTRTAENRATVPRPPSAGVTSVTPSSSATSGDSSLAEV